MPAISLSMMLLSASFAIAPISLAMAQSPPPAQQATAVSPDAIKQREQELEAAREEQRKAAELQKKLKADIAAHPSQCSLAYWHYPRYSTGFHGNTQEVIRFWRPLYRSGIEFVVNGHDHDYERWKKRRPGGTFAKRGIREFVVGTGGAALRDFVRRQPAKSVVRQATDHGVIKFTLISDSYRWEFVSADGTFTDTGSSSCHGRP